jgi:endothelin-converting enzyme/putative endopeptidase
VWPQYLADDGAPALTTLNVSQPEFQKAVDAVLTNEPLPALKVYLRFHVITAAAPSLSSPF